MWPSRFRNAFATLTAGAAGGVAWWLGLQWIFGAAQPALTDSSHQSAKMLAAFAPGANAPRAYGDPSILWYGLIAIGILHACVYAWIFAGRRERWFVRGVVFAGAATTLLVPWFEFYLPWNVMHEPGALVALEVVCWAGVQLLVGVTVAGVYELFRSRAAPAVPPVNRGSWRT